MGCCGGGFGRHGRGRVAGDPAAQEVAERGGMAGAEDPESILKVRLARGEITIEEYQQLREALRAPAS